ncbi:hypothetical protein BpHYR1_041804 [Brachionus plicatilis]|uniref:Uncharacterized protein n=1 Tax=Brachionus plicatilis TaxID=10195 RepID=A0A3M7QM33_BRAPC|nr:hypothetical protein BpHYR1_041804 [Brachionus plicatilis]
MHFKFKHFETIITIHYLELNLTGEIEFLKYLKNTWFESINYGWFEGLAESVPVPYFNNATKMIRNRSIYS